MDYIISDTHIGHKNILDYEGDNRPFDTLEEHDEELISRWNGVVTKADKVYHLGDVFFGKLNFDKIKRLNGSKILIMGNHDHYNVNYKEVFNEIYGSYEYRRLEALFTHYPVHESQLESRYKYNFHGHMHSKKLDDHRYINVSIENLDGLKPVLIDKIMENINGK